MNHLKNDAVKIDIISILPKDSVLKLKINSIVGDLLGHNRHSFSCFCQSVDETIAEKIVGLLRRMSDPRDFVRTGKYLVRHIFDVATIVNNNDIQNIDNIKRIFRENVAEEVFRYGRHCPDFKASPGDTMITAVNKLSTSAVYEEDYGRFLNEMVYAESFLDYKSAVAIFTSLTKDLVGAL